jgi:hypothetical protein
MGEKSHTGHRSSVSGKFVTEKYANNHPRTTQTERVPNPGRGDSDRSGGKKK